MFFLQYRTTGLPDRPDIAVRYGGAIVNCWIERPTSADAEVVAKAMIASKGWQVLETLETYQLSDGDHGMGENARQYYEQALLDKEVLVFLVYPAGETRS
jgi:hypothetical protein